MKIPTISFHIYLLLFLLVSSGKVIAQTTQVRTDYEILESLYSECIKSIITYPYPLKSKPVLLSFTEGIIPEKKIRIVTEAILSDQGLSITDDNNAAEYHIFIYIREASITLEKKNDEYGRNISLQLYARCLDSSGVVLYARDCRKHGSDVIGHSSLHYTDKGTNFSKNTRRTVFGEKPGKLRIVSFLSIIAVLAYFGFK
jgi:hypothetical protein